MNTLICHLLDLLKINIQTFELPLRETYFCNTGLLLQFLQVAFSFKIEMPTHKKDVRE